MNYFFPDVYQKSIYKINYEKLNENGKIIRRNKGDIQTSGGDQSNSESKGTRRKKVWITCQQN